MMSRKSRKGFSRLNTHEMVELNKNGQRLDSGSESEILDLTGVDGHGPGGGCCSGCCVWFVVLYMGLLTILVLLLGAFSGYILVTTWQISQINNSTTGDLHGDIEKLRHDFETHSKQTHYLLSGLKETTFSVNNSFSSLNISVNSTLVYLLEKAGELDTRLKTLESHPREILTGQIEDIHHQMSALDDNMRKLNQSLDELQAMREKMASIQSQMMSYQSQLKDLTTTIGDTVHGNTQIQDRVQAFSDKLVAFDEQLSSMSTKMNKSHVSYVESINSTAERLSTLQSQLSSVNNSMWEEMDGMRTNLSSTDTELSTLSVELNDLTTTVANIKKNISSLTTPTPTTPTVPTPATNSTTAAPTTSAPSADVSAASTTPKTPSAPQSNATSAPQTSSAPQSDTPSAPQSDTVVTVRSIDHIITTSHRDTEGTVTTRGASASQDSAVTTESPPDNPGDSSSTTELVSDERVATTEATEGEGKSSEGPLQVLQTLYDTFELYDLNDDGALVYSEFSRYLESPDVFDALDQNKSGYLTKDEIAGVIRYLKSSQDTSAKSETQT